jgi:hypothetical protein
MSDTTGIDEVLLHWSVRLRNLLQEIEPLGSFVHQTILTDVPSLQPHISVNVVGRLGFPLTNVEQLISVATKAPFGHGDQTIYDDTIRTAWQIDATNITIEDCEVWTTYFNKQVKDCCFHLGISNERFDALNIGTTLYKMLIYETGGHFAPHRDTEKEIGMFGTLIIQLPTSEGFMGGELTVKHEGGSKTIDLSIDNDDNFQAIAFYSDCEHQLHPITNGRRVCLIYNLVAFPTENTNIPLHIVNVQTELNLRSIVQEWISKAKKIKKIGYQLEHQYTYQSINFSTLKGRDEIIFATLRNAQDNNGKKLFHASILLMELYLKKSRYTIYDQYLNPFKLIEESDHGSFKTTTIKSNDKECNMNCFSKKGWWVMPGVVVQHGDILMDDSDTVSGKQEIDNCKYSKKRKDDSCIRDDDGTEFASHVQMFLTRNGYVKEEHGYYGNEYGSTETWYNAAAIIISPKWDEMD